MEEYSRLPNLRYPPQRKFWATKKPSLFCLTALVLPLRKTSGPRKAIILCHILQQTAEKEGTVPVFHPTMLRAHIPVHLPHQGAQWTPLPGTHLGLLSFGEAAPGECSCFGISWMSPLLSCGQWHLCFSEETLWIIRHRVVSDPQHTLEEQADAALLCWGEGVLF